MTGWQSMETAPKDGTHVRLRRKIAGAGSWEAIGFWGKAKAQEDGYRANEGAKTWLQSDGVYMAPTPTHWMPKTGA